MQEYQKAFKQIFCFKGYIICGISVDTEKAVVTLKRTEEKCRCPKCKRRCSIIETYTRSVRDLDICGKECYISIETYHIQCSCGYYGMERLDFLDKYARYTKRFVEYVAMLCEIMCLKDVAKVAKIDWKTAKRIDKEALKKLVKDLKNVNPRKIGVDEIAYEKGHKCLTINSEGSGFRKSNLGYRRKSKRRSGQVFHRTWKKEMQENYRCCYRYVETLHSKHKGTY